MSVKKSEEVIARDIVEQMRIALPTEINAFLLEGVDANGDPTITFGTQTTNNNNGYIRVTREATSGVDSLGLSQRVYQPHVIQVCVEESATAGVSFFKLARLSRLLAIVLDMGTKVEIYLSDTTVVPVLAQVNAANLFETIWPDVYNKMKNAV